MAYSTTEFETIYMHCFPPSMRLAVSMLHDEEEARDVVQETFLKLWESDAEIKNPEAFVVRSVRNACINRIQTVELRERIRRRLPLDDTLCPESDADEAHGRVNAATRILLSARERQVIEKIYGEGMSYKEAAGSLGVSVALINKCVVNALKILRNHFKQHSL